MAPRPTGLYSGRLAADGDGNLLADEGEFAGYPVTFHDGSYIFVQPGEPSHNERYHEQFLTVDGTRDAESLERLGGDTELANAGAGENMHHFETQEDDDHYDADAPNKTKPKVDPDKVAATLTGHTEAYRG